MGLTTRITQLHKPPIVRRHWLALKIIAALLILSVVAYFGICAYMADELSQPKRQSLSSTPADYGLAYERVQFTSAVDNIMLQGWYIYANDRKTILMLHGRDGKRDDPTIGMLDIAHAFAQNGYDVLMFDSRGHGESGGTHLGLGTLEVRDVAGALSFLKTRGVSEVGAIGFSPGAVTTLNSAVEYPAMRALVADSAFADLQPLLDAELPKASGLPTFFTQGMEVMSWAMFGSDLANDKPLREVARLETRPLLLIHGTSDTDVPVSHAYALQQAGASNPNLQVWIVPNAEYVRAFKRFPQEYLQRVLAFFNKYL